MRIFAKDNVVRIMDLAGMSDETPIESRHVSNSVETAQRRIEGQHFDHRKNLLEYDDVMNQQRQTIYAFRLNVLKADHQALEEICLDSIEDVIRHLVDTHCNSNLSVDRWNLDALVESVQQQFGVEVTLSDLGRKQDLYLRRIYFKVQDSFFVQRDSINAQEEGLFFNLAREQYLQIIDELWKQHLQMMDQLRSGIGLRGYGQRDPKREYQREGFNLFRMNLINIKSLVIQRLCFVSLMSPEEVKAEQEAYERYIAEQERRRDAQVERDRRARELASARRSPTPDDILAPARGSKSNARSNSKKGRKGKQKRGKGRVNAQRSQARANAQDLEYDSAYGDSEATERPEVLPSRNSPCWCGSG
jgi:preprotein translocase subunit SecA